MKNNVIVDKTHIFSKNIIHWYRKVYSDPVGQYLGQQLLRSGTSIGANVNEAQGACSEKDFIHKFSIAEKEARESRYWIKLFIECSLFDGKELKILEGNIEEVIRIINKILMTLRKRNMKIR